MKNSIILFLFLIPAFLFAQYPATGNKSRLGYQTTGDGLIWRGVAADTVTKPRTTANAYFQLDTVNGILRRYIATLGKWQTVGGGGASIDSLVYSTIKGLNDSIQAEKQTLAFANPLLGISDGNNVDLSPLLSGYITGSGTNNRIPKWSAATNLTDSDIQDNGTAVSILSSKPFQLGQWTTAGRPSGTAGYMGWRDGTTLEWYNGTRWAAGLESTFARGTATRIPFFDANGQITESNNISVTNLFSPAEVLLRFGGVRTWEASNNSGIYGISSSSTGIRGSAHVQFDFFIRSSGASTRGLISSRLGNTNYMSILQNNIESITFTNFGMVFYPTSTNDANLPGGNHSFSNLSNKTAIAYSRVTETLLNTYETISTWNGAGAYNINTTTLQLFDSTLLKFRDVGAYLSENLGVFTKSPTQALDVNGNAHIRERMQILLKTRIGSDSSFVHDPAVDTTNIKGTLRLDEPTGKTAANQSRVIIQSGGDNTPWASRTGSMVIIGANARRDTSDFPGKTPESVIIGSDAYAEGGSNSYAHVVIGDGAYTNSNAPKNTVIGARSSASRADAVVIGFGNTSRGNRTISIGTDNIIAADSAYAFGHRITNNFKRSIAIGYSATTTETQQVLIGSIVSPKINFYNYGTTATTAAALSKTLTNYGVGFATDGTVTSREIKRDTTIYVTDADYDFSAAITTAQIASRFNRVIFWMTTTAAAGSDSELTLHTPDVNLMQVEYLIHSVDEAGGFDNRIIFGTNNAVDSTNGLVTNYYPAAGDGIHIRAGLRSGVYKYRYSN